MEKKQRSPILVIGLALIIGVLVIALLNGTVRPTQVLVAKVGLLPGTLLTADLVETRSIPAGGVPSDALRSLDEAQGQMLAVGRAPGDLITQSVLGQASASGIPSQLEPGYVAMAVKVNQSSGVAGVVREGQNVTVIGMLPPSVLSSNEDRTKNQKEFAMSLGLVPTPYVERDLSGPTATPEPTPTPLAPQAPLGRIAVTGLRVLVVPQQFRYQELPPGGDSSEQVFAAGNATANSVIVLAVPTTPVEVAPGMFVNPATLLAALDQYGSLHLAIEPTEGAVVESVVTLNLGDLYEAMNSDR